MSARDLLRPIRSGIRRALRAEALRRQARQIWATANLLEAASAPHPSFRRTSSSRRHSSPMR